MSLDIFSGLRQYRQNHPTAARRRAANLSLLCECLAVGETYDEDLPARLTAQAVDWRGLCWLAGAGLVTPSLAGALKRKGLFHHVPEEVQEYLQTLQSLNHERNDTLRAQLIMITATLNKISIYPLLLKGAITLLPDQYPGAEDRVIGDLDLLVPDDQIDTATEALIQIGYELKDDGWQFVLPSHLKEHHHGFPLVHPTLPVKVELHRRITHDQADDELLFKQRITAPFNFAEGVTVIVPDEATRLIHNMLHCQISDRHRAKRVLNLRQLLEFAALSHHEAASLDIAPLINRLRPQRDKVLAEYWAQAEHWFKAPYPINLPRSTYEKQNLWLLTKVATHPGVYRLFATADWLGRLPKRLPNLWLKLWLMPGYFPVKIRAVLKGWSS